MNMYIFLYIFVFFFSIFTAAHACILYIFTNRLHLLADWQKFSRIIRQTKNADRMQFEEQMQQKKIVCNARNLQQQ